MPSQPDSPGDLEVGELLVNAVVIMQLPADAFKLLPFGLQVNTTVQLDTHIDKYDIIDKF